MDNQLSLEHMYNPILGYDGTIQRDDDYGKHTPAARETSGGSVEFTLDLSPD